jgi:GMP synthase (glutamine-hydrolysing)
MLDTVSRERDDARLELAAASRTAAGRQGPRKPILIVLHQHHSSPGRIGYELTTLGHALDIRRPRFGDPLPETLAEHDGAIIFGGPMSANDPDDWIRREIDWIGVPLKENKPYLGVCLGAQMLARQLGARVARHEGAEVEIGYYDLTPTCPTASAWPQRIYHWHGEGFEIPAGARRLATSNGPFPNQAMAIGRAVGVQFHPEITWSMVNRWTTTAARRLVEPGAQPRDRQLADHLLYAPAVHGWLHTWLDTWTGHAR